MLPVVLVLLVASSALAAPSVSVTQVGLNEIGRPVDNGRLVSSYIVDGPFELVDGGDQNIYILTIQQILNDLASQAEPSSQALAVAQMIAVLGELATGVPSDACAAASLINAYAAAASTGNYNNVQPALAQFLGRLSQNIDLIAQLNANNENLKYTSLPKGTCSAGGRTYNFEGAWDAILARSNPYQISLLNELYCATGRLYRAFNVRSNNIGALVTASALGPVVNIVSSALPQLSNFLKVVAAGGNAAQSAAAAKSALARGATSFSY